MNPQKFREEPEDQADLAEIRRSIALLFPTDAIVELRVLKGKDGGIFQGTVSGYYDGGHRKELAEAAERWNGKAPGVYITLNPVRPDLLARAKNRCIIHAKDTTKDNEILQRYWLLIDFDPKRPSGISANSKEKDAALDHARDCRSWLTGQGWPEPILADSGNGFHMLYRIDLPNDQVSTELVKDVLNALAGRFSDSVVDVDRSVFNAARICKLYGSLSAKGDSTPERPHRRSKILEVPASLEIVSGELLESIAGQKPPEGIPRNTGPSSGLKIEKWLSEHGFNTVRIKEYSKEDRRGTLYDLARCPWRPDEKDGGAFVIQWNDGAVTAGCHHAKCIDRGWGDLLALAEIGNANNSAGGFAAIEGPDDPHRLARIVRDDIFRVADGLTITYWRGRWYF
jgi:hypothetical protein